MSDAHVNDAMPETADQPQSRSTAAGDNLPLGGHVVQRDGVVGGDAAIPTPEEFAAQERDGRAGDSIGDLPFGDEEHHEAARDASGWDEKTDELG